MADPQTPQSAPDQGSGQKSALARRALIAILVFGVVLILSFLLPSAMPGEMPQSQLAPRSGPVCTTCPPSDQLTGLGMLPTSDGLYVNVQFAAPPLNTLLRVAFAGMPGEVDFQQFGQSWNVVGNPSVRPAGIMASENKVVVAFPATLSVTGVAAATGSGDRMPYTGFLAPTYPAAPHFNATDVVLLIVLGLTAYYGFRRGFVVEVSDLIVLALSLTVSALLARPIGSAIAGVVGSAKAGAIGASALLVIVFAVSGAFFVRKYLPKFAKADPFDARTSAILGALTGCVRQLPVLALLLAAGTGLAVLHWASANIQSSLIGSALIQAWQAVYVGAPHPPAS
jgi:uncharacterized membrane protein required for colicin V production